MNFRDTRLALLLAFAWPSRPRGPSACTYQFTPFGWSSPAGDGLRQPSKINASGSIVNFDFSGMSIIFDTNGVGTWDPSPGREPLSSRASTPGGRPCGAVYTADDSSSLRRAARSTGHPLLRYRAGCHVRLPGRDQRQRARSAGRADSAGLIIDKDGNQSTTPPPAPLHLSQRREQPGHDRGHGLRRSGAPGVHATERHPDQPEHPGGYGERCPGHHEPGQDRRRLHRRPGCRRTVSCSTTIR